MSYAKVEKVIDSCKTQAQLKCATRFKDLWFKAKNPESTDSQADALLVTKIVNRAQMIQEGWV